MRGEILITSDATYKNGKHTDMKSTLTLCIALGKKHDMHDEYITNIRDANIRTELSTQAFVAAIHSSIIHINLLTIPFIVI